MERNGCRERILEGYGMTEIGSAAYVNLPQHNVNISVGVLLPLNHFCIYDNENNKELSYGEVGVYGREDLSIHIKLKTEQYSGGATQVAQTKFN